MTTGSTGGAGLHAAGERQWVDIRLRDGETVVGRSGECDVTIRHASVSRKHLRLIKGTDGLEIVDLDSRFGTFVNGSRIKKCMLKPDDSVRFGSSPPYRYDGRTLRVDSVATGMAVRLSAVAVERGGKVLLDHVDASVASGSFVGVLGPSGSGKSLLLACISSTLQPTRGMLSFDDDRPVRDFLEEYRCEIGMITQDDLVYESLTVDENLAFAARLRCNDLAGKERENLIDKALESVGLRPHRHKQVRVLSGGQRKRVSIALELLDRPRLLLLDEPTSGLDPGLQASLMEILRELSRHGTTVICTTHTLDTLHFFDSLLVLGLRDTTATVVYTGSPHELFSASDVHDAADLFGRLQDTSAIGHPAPVARDTAEPETRSEDTKRFRQLHRVSHLQRPDALAAARAGQISIVLRRSLIGLWRDRGAALLVVVAQPLILTMLIFISQFNQDRSTFIHFFLLVAAVWMGMTVTIREIVRERSLYIRDRLAGLHPEAYLIGKLLFAAAIVGAQVMLMFGMGWCLVDAVRYPAFEALLCTLWSPQAWTIAWSVGIGGATIGLVVSTLARTERAAVALLPLVLLPQMLLSRVAYGDGSQSWNAPSPYRPIVVLLNPPAEHGEGKAKYVVEGDAESPSPAKSDEAPGTPWAQALSEYAVQTGSMAMLTRPGTAAMDFVCDDNVRKRTAVVFGEWAYLAGLLLAHLLLLYVIFLKAQASWQELR